MHMTCCIPTSVLIWHYDNFAQNGSNPVELIGLVGFVQFFSEKMWFDSFGFSCFEFVSHSAKYLSSCILQYVFEQI